MFSKFCKKIIPLFLAFIIFISSVVPVSASEIDDISLTSVSYTLNDFLYSYNTDSDLTNLTGIIDSLSSSYCPDVLIYSYSGSYGARYYGAVNLRYCSAVETANGYIYSVYNDGKYAKDLEQTSKFTSNTNFASLASYYSLSDTNAVLTFFIPKTDLYNFYVCYGTVKTLRETFNYNIEQYALSSKTDTPDWSHTGIVYRGIVHFVALNKAFHHVTGGDLEFNPSGTSVPSLGIDVEGFTEFYKLTVNGYLDNLNKYFGDSFLKIDTSTIGYLVGYYNAYGSSDKNFSNINCMPDLQPIFKDGFFIHTPVGNIPLPSCFIRYSDYKKYMDVLRVRLQSDYQDYLRMMSMLIPDVTPVIKDNSDLIVDVDTDTTDITLFREIIRLLANISNNLTVNFSAVVNGLNAIANLLANINFNINPDIDVDIDPSVLGNNMVGLMNNLVGALNNLIVTLPSLLDNINISANVPDEDFLTWLFVPTFDDFDEIYLETVEKFPVLQEISTLPDTELDDVLGLPVNNNPQIDQQNLFNTYGSYKPPENQPELPFLNDSEYNYSYSDSDITSKDLFTFTVPAGQSNDLLKSVEGQTISIVNFKKFSKAIAFFKGVISVLAVYAFCKWLLQYVPKIVTGSATGD